MPSSELKLISGCAYLTDVSNRWRDADWAANKMVKALKGDVINGHFYVKIGGKNIRFDQKNVGEFVERIPRFLQRAIAREVEGTATIVPIPNSHVTAIDTPDFRTLDLANAIARESGGRFAVVPALVFSEPQPKSHEGGSRDPKHFERVYRITGDVKGPIVLVDDVCTTGGHFIGAHWRLDRPQSPVILAAAFGRTEQVQVNEPIGFRSGTLNVARY